MTYNLPPPLSTSWSVTRDVKGVVGGSYRTYRQHSSEHEHTTTLLCLALSGSTCISCPSTSPSGAWTRPPGCCCCVCGAPCTAWQKMSLRLRMTRVVEIRDAHLYHKLKVTSGISLSGCWQQRRTVSRMGREKCGSAGGLKTILIRKLSASSVNTWQ